MRRRFAFCPHRRRLSHQGRKPASNQRTRTRAGTRRYRSSMRTAETRTDEPRTMRWRRIAASHPLLIDALVAVAITVASLLQGAQDVAGTGRQFDRTAITLTVLATLPSALRRRAPITVLLVCCAFWLWYARVGYFPAASTYGILLAFYTVATVHPWWRVLACLAVCCAAWVAGVTDGPSTLPAAVAQGIVVPAVVWRVADGAQRLALGNRRLAAAGAALARQAVLDERVRIARELHDVVAHHMSVVAVQAGLARYVLRSDPDTADSALGTVLDTSAEALDELRRLLELLRLGTPATGGMDVAAPASADPSGYEPAPGLAYLPELFNRVRAAGVPVEVTVAGTPQPLPSGLELCAYRIVQESLTNVLKHAAPATVRIVLHYGGDELTVSVTDDGRRSGGDRAPAGNGLIGMRERAMMYGGTLHAAPRPGGGFEVRLALPLATVRRGPA
jgi:signal transduction histidine kinase